MKFLLKHIIRSARKKPLQPIIIILTIALAMATSVFAFTIADTMKAEAGAAQTAKYGKAEFIISVGNTSESRFLFADDVVDATDSDVIAVGCYELPMILGETKRTTVAMATELCKVGDLFDIEFSEYGKVTEGSLGDVAFISSDFALEHGLSIGDTFRIETMGYDGSYRVEGISERPFLAAYDVMIDISGLIRAFASNSLLFAAIGEDFKPCNKVYVNTEQCGLFEEHYDAISFLKSDSRFADKIFEDLNNIEIRQTKLPMMELVINFAVALTALLSAVVVFSCFYILANERTEENLALTYSGASPVLLAAMQYSEALLYLAFGVPLGILAAIPLTKCIGSFVSLRYVEPSIELLSVQKSGVILIAVCLLTTAFFIAVSRRMRRTGEIYINISAKWSIYLIFIIAGSFAAMYFLPANPRLVMFVFTIAFIVCLIFFASPFLVQRIACAAEKRMGKARKPAAIAFRYALKNICSLKLLHNIARLCTLIVATILTVGMVFASVYGQIKNLESIFDADYVIFNSTDACYGKAQTCESADGVYRAYVNQTSLGLVLSADEADAYADWLKFDAQPNGNEAVISSGIARANNIGVGDSLCVALGGVEYEFVVSHIVSAGSNYIGINCKDMGIQYNILLVQGKSNVLNADLLGELSKATASELAPIAEVDTLLEQFIDVVDIYIDAGKILLFVLVVFSLIGMADVFYESLRARREEFELYRISGMTRREIRLMKASELTVTVLLGLFIGIGAFVIAAFAVNIGMTARGMEIFLGILSLFR